MAPHSSPDINGVGAREFGSDPCDCKLHQLAHADTQYAGDGVMLPTAEGCRVNLWRACRRLGHRAVSIRKARQLITMQHISTIHLCHCRLKYSLCLGLFAETPGRLKRIDARRSRVEYFYVALVPCNSLGTDLVVR